MFIFIVLYLSSSKIISCYKKHSAGRENVYEEMRYMVKDMLIYHFFFFFLQIIS